VQERIAAAAAHNDIQVRIDPLGSERAKLGEEAADGLAAARGILIATAAGIFFWLGLGYGLRTVWLWLAG
jgi:hypothetical protein